MNIQQRVFMSVAIILFLGLAGWETISSSKGEINMERIPLCQTSTDMKRLDGHRVQLVGIYRKRLIHKKKPSPMDNSPPLFMGHVFIEVEGSPQVYDQYQAPDSRSMVRLGLQPRPPEEVDRFVDKKVIVEGKLLVDVSSLAPPPDVAQVAEPPVLMEFQDIAEY